MNHDVILYDYYCRYLQLVGGFQDRASDLVPTMCVIVSSASSIGIN